MRNTKCPECGGIEIFKREVDSVGGYGPDLLPGVGRIFKRGKYELRVCGSCGFTRWFVPERFLKDIREKGKFVKE